MGGFTQQVRNPDSWEGWYWGSRHIWGKGLVGHDEPGRQHRERHLPEHATWWWSGAATPRPRPGASAASSPAGCSSSGTRSASSRSTSAPKSTTRAAIHADKWIPILPNTDAALQLAIMLHVDHRGHLRQGVRRDPHRGLRQDQGLRHGRGRRRPQDPAVGLAQVRRAGVDHQGAGARLGQEDRHHRPLLRRRHGPRARTPTSRPDSRSSCWACRAGQAGRPPVADRLPGHAAQHPGRRQAVHGHVQQPGRRLRSATGCSSRTAARRRPGASSSSPRPSSRRPSTVRRWTSGARAATRSPRPTSTRSTPIPSRRRRAAPRST